MRKSSLETILDDLYFLVDAVPRMVSSGPVRPVAAVAVQLFRRRDGGVRAPPRTQVRWLCLGARSCRRLITVEGGRAGWLVALPGWWPVRSGLGLPATAIMIYLLTFGSGKRNLERSMVKRPGYPEYMKRTSGFVPLLPKNEPAGPAAKQPDPADISIVKR